MPWKKENRLILTNVYTTNGQYQYTRSHRQETHSWEHPAWAKYFRDVESEKIDVGLEVKHQFENGITVTAIMPAVKLKRLAK